MHLSIPAGTTSKIISFPVYDSSSTVGATLAGLVYNTSSLTAYYNRTGAAGAATAISLATMTKGTWASSGFVAVDGTNMPGWYELGIPDAALAASCQQLQIMIKGAANMVPVCIEIELTAVSNQDAVRGGMTALPNANAEAAGGLYTRGTGAGQINQAANGNIDVNAVKMSGTALTGRDIGASVLISSGTGTGQLSVASGVIAANMTQIDGNATSGNNATLKLKQLDITNSCGTAVIAKSTGGNGIGIDVAGQGTGSGILINSGASGGHGLTIRTSGNGDAINAIGNGSGRGLYVEGGSSGMGAVIVSGLTGTIGLYVNCTNGPAVSLVSTGANGAGLSLAGNGSGAGLLGTGGSTGSGMSLVAGASGGAGLRLDNSNNGVLSGLQVYGGATLNQYGTADCLTINGGSTTGAGIKIATTSGNGITIAAGGGNGDALQLKANGTGSGISIDNSGKTGVGLKIRGGNGVAAVDIMSGSGTGAYGMLLVAGGSGMNGLRIGGNSASGLYCLGGDNSAGAEFVGGTANPSTGGSGIVVTGTGECAGLSIQGGPTGHGCTMVSGASGTGHGLYCYSTAGDGARMYTLSGNGLTVYAVAGGSGLSATADGANHSGIYGHATASGGAGITLQSELGDGAQATSLGGNGHGLNLVANGSGYGLLSTGGSTGGGAKLLGGACGGNGLLVQSQYTTAMSIVAAGNGAGVSISGYGSGNGLTITPGATGSGIYSSGGTGGGDGLKLVATYDGSHGLSSTGYGSGNGVYFIGGGSTGSGLKITAPGAGGGIGLYISSSQTTAMSILGGGSTGKGLLVSGSGSGLDIALATAGNQNLITPTTIDTELTTQHGSGSWQTGGSSTLTSQDVRDAMKLAPTSGSPATGSVDKHLDDIEADTTSIEGKVDTVDTNVDDIETIVSSGTYGNAQLLTAIQNVQNGTFVNTTIPAVLERPDTGSTTVSIVICFADETGTAKDLDCGNPSITLVNDAGTDKSSRLGSFSHPATGKYVIPYTNTSTDAIEGLHWDVTGIVNLKERRYPAYMQIVDTTAVSFTATDRSNLEAVKASTDNLPSDPADQSEVEAAIGVTNDKVDALSSDVADVAIAVDDINNDVDALTTTAGLIKDKTDNLPSDPADQSAVEAAITVTNDKVDALTSDVTDVAIAVDDINDDVDALTITVGTIKDKTDNLPASPAATGDAMTLTAAYDAAKTAAQAGDAMILTAAYDACKTALAQGEVLVEGYAAKGASLTLAQALYMLVQYFEEFSMSGTLITIKKRNQSDTALTLLANSATAPKNITRNT